MRNEDWEGIANYVGKAAGISKSSNFPLWTHHSRDQTSTIHVKLTIDLELSLEKNWV